MVQHRYVYWCISHQKRVVPNARTELRERQHCKIVKLNLMLLRQIDLHALTTWISSRYPSDCGLSRTKSTARSRQVKKDGFVA